MKESLAKAIRNFQGIILLAVLIYTTVVFGGNRETPLYYARLLVIFALGLQALIFLWDQRAWDCYKRLRRPAFLFSLFLLFVWCQHLFGGHLMKGFWFVSVHSYTTYDALVQLMVYAAFFVVSVSVFQNKKQIQRIGFLILWFVLVITVLGIIQRLGEQWIPEGGPIEPHKILWRTLLPFSSGSFFGPFVNENDYGSLLVLMLPLAMGLLHSRMIQIRECGASAAQEGSFPKPFWKEPFNYLSFSTVFLFLLIPLMIGACFFAEARAPGAALLLCTVAYFAVPRIGRKNLKPYFLLALALIPAFLLLGKLAPEALDFTMGRLLGSLWGRFTISLESLRLFFEFPIFGMGLGCYAFMSSKVIGLVINQGSWNYAHNDYVELLAETGLVGFCLFLGAMVSLFLIFKNQKEKVNSPWERVMIHQTLIAVLGIALIEVVGFHLKIPAIAFFFVVQLAIAYSLSAGAALTTQSSEGSEHPKALGSSPQRRRWLPAAICMVITIFLFLHTTTVYRAHQSTQSAYRLEGLKKAVAL